VKNKSKPPVSLFLPREIFNTLVSALEYFTATENEIGKTFFSKHAVRLKEKIMKHGRAFKNDGGENVSVYFYDTEAAVLLKLLIYYISLGENPHTDFFIQLKKSHGSDAKNGGVENAST
jgi:hypothetical protein